MFFHRKKARSALQIGIRVPDGQVVEFFDFCTVLTKFLFLLICADDPGENEATAWARESLNQWVSAIENIAEVISRKIEQLPEGVTKEISKRGRQLEPPYRFFGETMFKPLVGDANAVIAEMEKVMTDKPAISEDRVGRDIIMNILLESFGNPRKCCETQEEIIYYLCKRWNISDERYQELKGKCVTAEEIEAMLDRIAKNLGMDEGDPTPVAKQE